MKNCDNCPALQALKDILHPIGKMEREMPEGYRLNGMAVQMADMPSYLREIAQEALRKMEADQKKLRGQMKHTVMLDDSWEGK